MTPSRRYGLDDTVERFDTTLVGGSPLRLFRLTSAGASVVDRIARGDPVGPSPLVDRLLDAGAIHPVVGADDGGPFTSDDVTIVVPTLGEPARVPAGAVVVDDGSVPPVDAATVRLDVNRGPGAARNAGLATVTTPLVAFVDADVALTDGTAGPGVGGWLDLLLPHFTDPHVALVAPRVRTALDDATGFLGRYEQRHGPLDMGECAARVRSGSRVPYVPSAAMLVRVDALRSVGGFDESLRFGEDVDLCWRLDDAGWHVRYEPAAVVHHEPRGSVAAWLRQRVDYGSSAAALARRHPRRLAPVRISPWSGLAWLLGALRRPLLATAVGAASAAALVPKLPDVPARAAFGLAANGNLHAGAQLAAGVRRVWFPLVAVAALRSRTARRVALAALVAARDPVRIVDDLAYCAGVWRGMFHRRTLDPILPDLGSWPGRAGA